ncbi:hypothetical protein [Pseudonocardia asaccharolytica]|uniref:Uncharacterized protein n=1 Tax=Pseudonocardia asaccharolytica DSM 44247 = NBRC 16224 TaxID=1123024 RepID=A0A511D2Z8_9PSEU|nr:hypothetical protein [Pseudonocardia asaccharolytica]GEL19162.1 hypothetical protein PA7_29990 [Pseudonocardia asaccharolytica DSM 44247 = NBRC 16224]
MITVIAVGFGVLLTIGVIVGILDAANAAQWRWVAAERRRDWEDRQLERSAHGYDSWADEDE